MPPQEEKKEEEKKQLEAEEKEKIAFIGKAFSILRSPTLRRILKIGGVGVGSYFFLNQIIGFIAGLPLWVFIVALMLFAVIFPKFFDALLGFFFFVIVIPALLLYFIAIVKLPLAFAFAVFGGYVAILFATKYKTYASIFIVFIMLLLIGIGTGAWAQAGIDPDSSMGRLFESTQTELQKAWLFATGAPEKIGGYWEKQIAIATGDLYTAEVDAAATKRFGVFLENIKVKSEFQTNEPIYLTGNLKVETPTPINEIKLFCALTASLLYGEIFPSSIFSVDRALDQDFDCEIASDSPFEPGVKKLVFGASFDFETFAYSLSYLMDDEAKKALEKKGKDPIDFYGVVKPFSKTSQGPISIGAKVSKEDIISVKRANDTLILWGVTIENVWEGKLNKIEKIIFIVPKPIEIKKILGFTFRVGTCEEVKEKLCDPKKDSVYVIDDEATLNKIMKEINNAGYQTLSIRLKLNRADQSKVLTMPLNPVNFKVNAKYVYETKIERIVSIKKAEEVEI